MAYGLTIGIVCTRPVFLRTKVLLTFDSDQLETNRQRDRGSLIRLSVQIFNHKHRILRQILPHIEFILFDDSIIWFCQNGDQITFAQTFDRRNSRQSADQLGNETKLVEIISLGLHVQVISFFQLHFSCFQL